MGKVKLLLINLGGLLKAMAVQPVFWGASKRQLIRSDIHEKAKVYFPVSAKDFKMGEGSYVSANANINNTRVGKFCSIGPNFLCGWGTHPIHGMSTSPLFYSTKKTLGYTYSGTDKVEEEAPVVIGNDVFIGANVTVLNGVTIGDGAVIGAGAVVSKDIPPYAVAVGCPIRIVKYRFDENTIARLLRVKWWDQDEAGLRRVEQHFFDIEQLLTELETATISADETHV